MNPHLHDNKQYRYAAVAFLLVNVRRLAILTYSRFNIAVDCLLLHQQANYRTIHMILPSIDPLHATQGVAIAVHSSADIRRLLRYK